MSIKLWIEFRFQTGSIKSISQLLRTSRQKSFDSKLVRLKAERYRASLVEITELFRFQTGSIKRTKALSDHWVVSGFDSKLVRLKVRMHHNCLIPGI